MKPSFFFYLAYLGCCHLSQGDAEDGLYLLSLLHELIRQIVWFWFIDHGQHKGVGVCSEEDGQIMHQMKHFFVASF